jgi:predicted DNA-binding transcriptional regulator AlpA
MYNLTVYQLAQVWDIAPNTIYHWIKKSALPHQKIKGKTCFDLKECQMWYRRYSW